MSNTEINDQPEAAAQNWGPRGTAGVSFASGMTFEAVDVTLGGRKVLDRLSLELVPGEIVCLLGESGSGKSTILRVAAGIQPISGGAVRINGAVVSGQGIHVPPDQRGLGLMFQDFALFPHMSILDNVRFGLTAMSKGEARAEALHALERVGLTHYADKYPHILSGGEQQRVALARALAPRPAVLLMDEPFSGLDSRLKDSIRADTLAILREARATAIVVTHDAEEAMRMADRIALIQDGRLVQVGTSDDLYRRPANIFAASFFSEVNSFEAVVRDGRAETPLGSFAAEGIGEGRAVDVAIRLQGIRLEVEGGAVPARVVSRRFLGVVDHFTLAVQGCDEPVRARIRADIIPQGLRDVTLSVNERDTLVFEKAAISD